MSTLTELNPAGPTPPLRPSPLPLRSAIAAAATRMNARKIERIGFRGGSEGWQEDAWDMYDLVGEQRYLARTLAARMGQARFFVARLPEDSTEDIEPLDSGLPVQVFDAIGSARAAFSQLVERAGINLFIAGDGYLVGTPPKDDDPTDDPYDGIPPLGAPGLDLAGVNLGDLEWAMKSVSEVRFKDEGKTVVLEDGSRTPPEYSTDSVVIIRIWRPHPRRWWLADSPTMSSLPVLRELVGLTMHISAQVDSRLAGAGVFLIPDSADRAVRAQSPESGGSDPSEVSPLVEAIMDAMVTPISDRSSASALVPIMPVVPDESIDKFRHISFAVPLDAETRTLRDEAIRRLALGQDCPPELLLGVGGMNHWGAWLVREDVVTSHLEPPLALICDALTTQLLWPVLEQHNEPDFQQYAIWYDVSHLIIRPNRTEDAKALHASNVIDDAALRAAAGFDETDADGLPDPVANTVIRLITTNPSLIKDPGLAVLSEQIAALLNNETPPEVPETGPVEEEVEEEPPLPPDQEETPPGEAVEGELPNTADEGPAIAASGQQPSSRGPVLVPYTHGASSSVLGRIDGDD